MVQTPTGIRFMQMWRDLLKADASEYGVSMLKDSVASLASPVSLSKFDADRGEMSVTCVLTTPACDRQGDIVEPEGVNLIEHQSNPIVMFAHGRDHKLPIGKAEDKDGNYTVRLVHGADGNPVLVGKTYFSQSSQFANDVFGLVAEDILRGISVGFDPVEDGDRRTVEVLGESPTLDRKALRFKSWKLLEYSHTPLGVNKEALTVAVHKAHDGSRSMSPKLLKFLEPYAIPRRATVTSGFVAVEKAFDEGKVNRDHGKFAKKASKTAHEVSENLAEHAKYNPKEGHDSEEYHKPSKEAHKNAHAAAEATKSGDHKLAREYHKDAAASHEAAADAHDGYAGADIRHAEAAKHHRKAAQRHAAAAKESGSGGTVTKSISKDINMADAYEEPALAGIPDDMEPDTTPSPAAEQTPEELPTPDEGGGMEDQFTPAVSGSYDTAQQLLDIGERLAAKMKKSEHKEAKQKAAKFIAELKDLAQEWKTFGDEIKADLDSDAEDIVSDGECDEMPNDDELEGNKDMECDEACVDDNAEDEETEAKIAPIQKDATGAIIIKGYKPIRARFEDVAPVKSTASKKVATAVPAPATSGKNDDVADLVKRVKSLERANKEYQETIKEKDKELDKTLNEFTNFVADVKASQRVAKKR